MLATEIHVPFSDFAPGYDPLFSEIPQEKELETYLQQRFGLTYLKEEREYFYSLFVSVNSILALSVTAVTVWFNLSLFHFLLSHSLSSSF